MTGQPVVLHVTDKPPDGGGIAQTIARYRDIGAAHGCQVPRVQIGARPAQGVDLATHIGRHGKAPTAQDWGTLCGTPDVIHLHLGFTVLTGDAVHQMADIAPLVVSLHDVSPFCPNGLRLSGDQACGRPEAAMCYATLCAGHGSMMATAKAARLIAVRRAVRRALRDRAAVVLAPSDYLAAQARRVGFGSVTVLPHSVAPHGEAEPARPAHDIAYIGRLTSEKGAGLVLDALNHLPPQTSLVFCGAGDLAADLQFQVAARGLQERVTFAGWCDRETLSRHVRAAHVVVQPSLVPEGFGLSVIEAASLKRATVTLGRGAHADLGPHVAQTATPDDLARAVLPFLQDAVYAARAGEEAYQRYRRDHDPATQSAALMRVYSAASSGVM